jgi:hypothetical protein
MRHAKYGGKTAQYANRRTQIHEEGNLKVTSPTLGTGGKRLWLLRSRPDQVDRTSMRGGPSRRILSPQRLPRDWKIGPRDRAHGRHGSRASLARADTAASAGRRAIGHTRSPLYRAPLCSSPTPPDSVRKERRTDCDTRVASAQRGADPAVRMGTITTGST